MRKTTLTAALAALAALALGACSKPADRPEVVKLDYATYNPVGLLLKEKRFLEDDLAKEGVKVEWTKSLGSNKALEFLSSRSVDFGSTAGAAAKLCTDFFIPTLFGTNFGRLFIPGLLRYSSK